MPAITSLDLNNAKLDVDFIAEIATSTAPTATNRLGHVNATMAAANNAIAQTAAGQATFARLGAESARDAALIQAGVYTTESAGRASVLDGQAFKVQGVDDIAAYEYRRVSSDTSVLINTYPSGSAKIVPYKTSFIGTGQNLFDKNAATVGKYLTETGLLADNPIYTVSDYLPVIAGKTYNANATGIRYSTFYTINKVVTVGGSEVGESPFTIPTGVAYIRVTLFTVDLNIFQIAEGTTAPPYEDFHNDIKLDKAVSLRALEFSNTGKNKFNSASVTTGHGITTNGVVFANSSYDLSDFIPVDVGAYKCNSSSIRISCYFDKNKTVVAGGQDTGSLFDSFTIPNGVFFVRLTVAANQPNLQIEKGTTSSSFESYRYVFKSKDGGPIYVQGTTEDSQNTLVREPAMSSVQYVSNGFGLEMYYENVVLDYQSLKGRVGISVVDGLSMPPENGHFKLFTATSPQIGTTLNGNVVTVLPSLSASDGAVGKSIYVTVSDAAKTTSVNVQNIGDSFTGRMTWANVLNGTPAFSGITYSGNRTANSTNQTVKCEGQGGWTMQSYFTVDFNGYLSPFMHPANTGLKYYGQTTFWIDANSTSPSYNADYFYGVRDMFSSSTGRKISPSIGDVMGEGGGYITWDGANWVTLDSSALGGFTFSYSRYRAVWGIPQPNIMHILLGTNDFYSATDESFDATYTTYKSRYETMIASIKADSPSCKIIVGIPVSSARPGDNGTLVTERVKRAMWRLAKNLVADFDNRQGQNIYLADYHANVSRVYGFDFTLEKPTASYIGADRLKTYTDITHCSIDGFNQMGNIYMGLVQYLR